MTRDVSQLSERVREYITENFLYMRPGFWLSDTEPLFASGIVDSLGVMELIAFAEQELEVQVEDEEITEANFGTVIAIARYVAAKPLATAERRPA